MLEQFNGFMEALDQQIDALNNEITTLESKKANLNKAREQFIETSKLLNTTDENIDIVKKEEPIEIYDELSEETSNYEEILPNIDYGNIVPIDEEQLIIEPIEDTTVSPVEVYDDELSKVNSINTEIDNSLLANLEFNISEQ